METKYFDLVFNKQKIRLIVFGVLCFGSYLCLKTIQDFKASGLAPILPIQKPDLDYRPIVYGLRDPIVSKRIPQDPSEAAQLGQEIKEIRTGISRLQGERAIEQNEQAYVGLVVMSYYLQDKVRKTSIESWGGHPGHQAGQTVSEAERNRKDLEDIAGLLENHAALVAKIAKNPSVKARATFFYYASRYSRPSRSPQDIRDALKAFRALGESKDLSRDLVKRAQLITAIHELNSSVKKTRVAATIKLQKISQSMEPVVRVGISLALAKAVKKINSQSSDSYKLHLMAASKRSGSLFAYEKSQVLRQIVSIWRQNDQKSLRFLEGFSKEKNGRQISKIPFSLSAFRDTPEALAIAERNALFDWQNGDKTKSITKYFRIANQAGSQSRLIGYKADLDLRTMDLRRLAYLGAPSKGVQKGSLADSYEKALVSKGQEYLDLGVLGPQGQQRAGVIRQQWVGYRRELVKNELSNAESKFQRSRSVRMAEAFINDVPKDAEIRVLKESLAKVYVADSNYESAVGIYRELAQSASPVVEKKRLYMLAIGAQSIMAQWPTVVPWDAGVPRNDQVADHREKLTALYQDLGRILPQDWFVVAQVGHLDMAQGNVDKAFQDWLSMISKVPRDHHASQAAGFMMTAYENAKNWNQLEKTSRLCLKLQVMGVYRQNNVEPHGKLGLALLEQGKGLLTAKNYGLAVTKLKEFKSMSPLPARHDEGFYSLTLAQWGNKQYRDSVQTSVDFVETYPKSQYVRSALLNGGDWSGMLAFEENVLWFHGRFLGRFPKDPETKRVREGLLDLTMGRELYGEALDLLASEAKELQGRGQSAEASQVEVKMINIEARHGSMERAVSRAKNAAASDAATDQVKAVAYGVMIQASAAKGQIQNVKNLVFEMSELADTQEKREAKAQGLLFIAQVESKDAVKELFNLELTNPLSTLNERYKSFQVLKANFAKVCAVGATASCTPALHSLARLSERFAASLEDINIQESLAKPYVSQFVATKQSIMNSIAKTTMDADQGSMATISHQRSEEGVYADPQWVEGVQWQNDAQWTVEKGQSLGNGFLQWPENRAGVVP